MKVEKMMTAKKTLAPIRINTEKIKKRRKVKSLRKNSTNDLFRHFIHTILI